MSECDFQKMMMNSFSREIDFSFYGKNKPCRMNMIDTYRFKSECILQKKRNKKLLFVSKRMITGK